MSRIEQKGKKKTIRLYRITAMPRTVRRIFVFLRQKKNNTFVRTNRTRIFRYKFFFLLSSHRTLIETAMDAEKKMSEGNIKKKDDRSVAIREPKKKRNA
jgi:hypothetical protein